MSFRVAPALLPAASKKGTKASDSLESATALESSEERKERSARATAEASADALSGVEGAILSWLSYPMSE